MTTREVVPVDVESVEEKITTPGAALVQFNREVEAIGEYYEHTIPTLQATVEEQTLYLN